MSSERILFVSPFYAPEVISTGRYNSALVEALAKNGAQVQVLTGYPTYPDWKPTYCSDEDASNGVEVIRGGLWLWYPRSSLLRRAVLEVWFCIHVALHLAVKRRDLNRIVCVLPPSLFVFVLGWLAPRDAKLIGIVHDLQGVLSPGGSHLSRVIRNLVQKIEEKSFARFSRLIFLSESMREHAIKKYGIKREGSVVCYPFVTSSVASLSEQPIEGMQPGAFNVVYAGALGNKQNPKQLYQFMDSLSENIPSVMCHIFSGGPEFESLRLVAEKRKNPRLKLHGLVPDEQLPVLYSCSDIQIIPQAHGTEHGSLPSKFPNLVAAGCFVLAICDDSSELSQLVRRFSCGHVCTSWELVDLLRHAGVAIEAASKISRVDRVHQSRNWIEKSFSCAKLVEAVLS